MAGISSHVAPQRKHASMPDCSGFEIRSPVERPDLIKGGASMIYQLYEMNHAAIAPFRIAVDAMKLAHTNPLNPLPYPMFGRGMPAGLELFARITRRYATPDFRLTTPAVAAKNAKI